MDIGDSAPDFNLPTNGGNMLNLADLKGKTVVLYFYPKDMTPGCTTESQDFRDAHKAFEDAGAIIVGASKDSVTRHDKFVAKHDLPFALVSDEEGTLCEDYGVWKFKKLYGREYLGIERTTFVIDGNGTIKNVWRKVKVKGHVEDVLQTVRAG